ncbi:hypothetical protein [Rhodonellum sp.]|uniref:hypothetical protein n=1 Tax=Rhodonellum sp. TaxID=2231180 RepID=UPI002721DAB9|nr:hypothetical protein [Rhodonellum sp.]MDO9553864.1 hypothetical protein [Rhodonellum sp.]
MNIPDNLLIDIDKSYTKLSIETFIKKHLIQFFSKNEELFKKKGIKLDILTQKKLTKHDFTDFFAQIIYDKEIFLRLLATLPKTIQEIFHSILLEGAKSNIELLLEFPKLVEHLRIYGNQIIMNPECFVLPHKVEQKSSYYNPNETKIHFYIPEELRKHFLSFIPIPDEYKLQPVDGPFLQNHVFNVEKEIISDLPLYIAYYLQGDIKYTASEKVQPGSIAKMKKACNIREFYEVGDKELLGLRTTFLADFLPSQKRTDPPQAEDVPIILVEMMTSLINENRISPLFHWLRHVKGTGYVKNNYEDYTVIVKLLRRIQTLPPGEWFSYHNLHKYLNLNFPKLEPVTPSVAVNYLYLDVYGRYGNDKLFITSELFDQVIREPLVKAFFFFLASLGLLEIAYDYPPDQPSGINQSNRSYLSPYDGLQFVRTTDLGAFVLGLKKDYQVPEQEKNYTLDLHTEFLLISYSGGHKILDMFLEKIANKSGEHRYKVDSTSFLKDCKSHADIHNKIVQFHKLIEENPPLVWTEFFLTLLEKFDPLQEVSNYHVFKIKPDNRELASLIARDEILKKIIIKAENFHFLVKENNKSTLKNRLASFGYLMT